MSDAAVYVHLFKRIVDVVLSASGLLALVPVLVVVWISVRVNLGAPVLFRQQRPGRRGLPFTLYKFRTMREPTDGMSGDAERLTPFGRWLRSTSVDEFPELFNVLRGDMSLVGPRPLLTKYLPRYSVRQAKRHSLRPGVTGLAQVHGRNQLSWEERLELDVQYTERPSFLLDLWIMWRTVITVFLRKGITEEGHATASEFAGSPTSLVKE